MRIATTLLRSGGSRHEIGGVVYHFAPGDDPARHVAEVADPAHAARFLSIPGFEPADEGAEPGDAYDGMDRDALAAAYEARFGKPPHHRLGEDTMRERLRAGVED